MLKHRFFISLLGTILLYVSVGILFFYLLNQTIGTAQKPQEKTISFSLASYEPERTPPVEEPVKEEPVVEPVEEIEPEKEEPAPKEAAVVEEVIPEPVIEKIIPKAKPIVKKIVKKKIVKKKHVKKKRAKKKTVKRKVRTKKSSSRKKASPAKKNKFLNQLRAKISRNKTYPRIAQRRGMQGSVKVRFTILRNGSVSNIRITGKKVFHSSAKSAVKKAFPVNTKNAPLSLPTTVNLTLRYQIR